VPRYDCYGVLIACVPRIIVSMIRQRRLENLVGEIPMELIPAFDVQNH